MSSALCLYVECTHSGSFPGVASSIGYHRRAKKKYTMKQYVFLNHAVRVGD